MTRASLAVVLACLIGSPVGVGAFTFVYAKGFSHLSPDPRACVNCHIMNAQYDAWLKSGHRHTATCVECHLPHEGLVKWVAKAEHGFRHSAAFTLQNFKEPIQITLRDRDLVRVNCLRCHDGLVHAVAASAKGELDCLHCHADGGGTRGSADMITSLIAGRITYCIAPISLALPSDERARRAAGSSRIATRSLGHPHR